MKKLLIAVFISVSFASFGQNLGYMGKKTSFGYKIDLGPNLGAMSANGKTIVPFDYNEKGSNQKTETGFTLHHSHGLHIERILGRKFIFHVSASRTVYGSFRFSEYLESNSTSSSSYKYYNFQKIPSQTVANDWHFSFIHYTDKNGLSAPLGFHVNYGLHIIDSHVRDADSKKQYLLYDHIFPMLSMGFGKTKVYANCLKIDYGLNFNFKPGNVVLTVLGSDGLIEGPDPDLGYVSSSGEAHRASKQATIRSSEANYFGGRVITFSMSIGFLTK